MQVLLRDRASEEVQKDFFMLRSLDDTQRHSTRQSGDYEPVTITNDVRVVNRYQNFAVPQKVYVRRAPDHMDSNGVVCQRYCTALNGSCQGV